MANLGAAVRGVRSRVSLVSSEVVGATVTFVPLALLASRSKLLLAVILLAWVLLGMLKPDLACRGRQVARMSLHQTEAGWAFASGLQLGSTLVLGFDRLCIIPLAAIAAVAADGRISALLAAAVVYGVVRAMGSALSGRLPASCGVSPETVGYSTSKRWDYWLVLPLSLSALLLPLYIG